MLQRDRASADLLSSPCAFLVNLLAHRLIVVLGKGGVGKTTLSAAFALYAAERGGRVVAAETDRCAPLAALFGREPSFEPVEADRRLAVVVLDGRHALEEYLRLVLPVGRLLNVIFSAKLYEHFVAAAPGLRELMMLGKLYYAMELSPQDERWETTVLDAPSSGQALGLLRMPFSARQTFSGGVVGREAENISRLLQDHRATCAALVSTPDHLSVKETMDNAAALVGLGIKIGGVILNRFRPARFNANDVKRLMLQASRSHRLRFPAHISSLAMREIKRAAQSSQALGTLTRHISAPALVVQDLYRLDGLSLVKQICANLASGAAERQGAPQAQEGRPRPNRKAGTPGDGQALSR